jgi:D-cysteine desulfhydrase
MARAQLLRLTLRRGGRRVHWIPMGGSTPLGMLGHVNAALELAEQVSRGEMPAPERVVVPFGTGGTSAGLALGFAIAGMDTRLVAARVGPRIAVNRRRVLRLARATARFIERATGQDVPRVTPGRVEVIHDVYGGAYGRPLAAGVKAAAMLKRTRGILLDDTYSAKALVAALSVARETQGSVLFWMTFDSRLLVTR